MKINTIPQAQYIVRHPNGKCEVFPETDVKGIHAILNIKPGHGLECFTPRLLGDDFLKVVNKTGIKSLTCYCSDEISVEHGGTCNEPVNFTTRPWTWHPGTPFRGSFALNCGDDEHFTPKQQEMLIKALEFVT